LVGRGGHCGPVAECRRGAEPERAASGAAPIVVADRCGAQLPAGWSGAAFSTAKRTRVTHQRAADDALRGDVERLREQVRELGLIVENAHPPPQPAPVVEKPTTLRPRPLGYQAFWPWVIPPEGISLGAYVQSQYEAHQDSQDQLQQGGAVLNKNRFLIRRARASLLGEWEYAAIAVEIDANTTNGPQVDLRKAEASLQYRPDRTKPPIVMATLGQFDTPFGYELVESPRTRWFMERSQTSLAFWPGEPDLGLRLAGALEFFRWTIAAVNGEPLGEKSAYV